MKAQTIRLIGYIVRKNEERAGERITNWKPTAVWIGTQRRRCQRGSGEKEDSGLE
jgi:hypothetical protein